MNTVVAGGWMLSTTAAILFLVGIPLWAKGLLLLRQDPLLLITFTLLIAFTFALKLQDSAMLSYRHARFVFWRNVACNAPPLFLLFLLGPLLEAHQLPIVAFAAPNVLTGIITSVFVVPRVFKGYRFFGCFNQSRLLSIATYSLATHAANLLWEGGTFLLPIIAINVLSAAATAYFYICWTLSNFVMIASRSVTTSLFVEMTRDPTGIHDILLQALRFILLVTVPLICLLWSGGHIVLRLFGEGYANLTLLRILLLSAVPFAINSICLMSLRALGKLRHLLLCSATVATGVVGWTTIFALRFGVEGIAAGWLLSQSLPALLAIGILLKKKAATCPWKQ
ncbi:MAG: hypothetical protein M3220_01865 [Chloroflexota bacterium]|nr:hypothetical protein [Chloroflexota bacterium]